MSLDSTSLHIVDALNVSSLQDTCFLCVAIQSDLPTLRMQQTLYLNIAYARINSDVM